MLQTRNRAGVSLREILPEARIFGADDIRITSCSGNAQECQPGDLFVAIVDADGDGHDEVAQAIDRGATALLTERPLVAGAPVCVVDDTREAFGRICHRLAGSPSDRMRVYGVTGTNGKTATSMLIASVLEAGGRGVGFTSSLGYSDGVKPEPASLTTPAAPQLAMWMQRMAANGCTDAVVEISSDALAQRRTAGLELDAAVLTNVRRDHIEEHGSIINYRKAKARIFKQLKPHGFAVVNADDPVSYKLLEEIDCPTITIGMKREAEITAQVLERSASEQTFLLSAGSETAAVRTRMIGDHHIYNCLTASAVGLVSGLDLASVVRGLETLDALPGRMERIECGQSFSVHVDNACSPHALAAALHSLRAVTRGRIFCVFGAEGDRDQDHRPLLGRVAERGSDWTVITSNNPGRESQMQIAHDILDGYQNPEKAHLLPDRAEAIYMALEKAKPGDAVLIAGKGQQLIQRIGGVEQPFDDRQTARDWLYDLGARQEKSKPAPFRVRRFSADDN
ncbi:UDP-N-acetylmuramoyl-L-alanyl-D-glutamate--2,6-diaminopimelate ligase [Lignipirellula cremea]|uniref:UDP-N-acetylmuramyl-tripeptide synthetase n=1 Tax=Lignipirellula cremea TaxID=2528010 RepID=A0A518DNM1_9BACT|nr:UDP-N-acetylmuramoyl-L-alanyl-D-glutamate--2,6-diaminopimelate ligase [Lignipirellula cremea]QDU93434.1 MurE-like ligase [Lignipirellula cremea]